MADVLHGFGRKATGDVFVLKHLRFRRTALGGRSQDPYAVPGTSRTAESSGASVLIRSGGRRSSIHPR